MLYFAYGSNMLTERLRARVPSAQPVTAASLPGFSIRFHKRSRDGSGKCNVVATPASAVTVYGVVFEVAPEELDALDEAERRGRGYERRTVSPLAAGTFFNTFAYIAQPAYVDDALIPYDWYHALVVAGAYQHDLPSHYVAHLEAVRSYPDPDEHRRTASRSILADAGFSDLLPVS